jgi:uncharacterized membrane protein
MRLLLLNNNPAVSRLIKLSADKAGYELDEFEDYGLVPLSNYDVVLVDNELYDADLIAGLKEHTGCEYVIYVCQRGAQKPEGVNVSLEKPFLPTDFLALLDKVKNVLSSIKTDTDDAEEISEELKEEASLEGFDIDNIDTLDGEDEDEEPQFTLPIQDDTEEDDDQSLSLEGLELSDTTFGDELMDEELAKADEETKEEEFSLDDFEETLPSVPEEEVSVEHTPCVLDKDDIDEVKQLLDDSEDEEDTLEIDQTLASLEETPKDESQFFFDEADEEASSEKLELPSLEDELLSDEEEMLSDLNTLEEKEHPQEEMIDSFEEMLDESIAEEKADLTFSPDETLLVPDIDNAMALPDSEDAMEIPHVDQGMAALSTDELRDQFEDISDELDEENAQEDEALSFSADDELLVPDVDKAMALPDSEEAMEIPQVDVAIQEIAPKSAPMLSTIDSLDDLSENLLKSAFGEDVEEEPLEADIPEKQEDIEVIRGEIENSIARSISGLAKSDILKEALKGMRINISITFDEK